MGHFEPFLHGERFEGDLTAQQPRHQCHCRQREGRSEVGKKLAHSGEQVVAASEPGQAHRDVKCSQREQQRQERRVVGLPRIAKAVLKGDHQRLTSFVDEYQRHQRRENLVGESREIPHQIAGVGHGQQHGKQPGPQPDPCVDAQELITETQLATQPIKDNREDQERPDAAQNDERLARKECVEHSAYCRSSQHFNGPNLSVGRQSHDAAESDRWRKACEEQEQNGRNALCLQALAEVIRVVRCAPPHILPQSLKW